jgi:exodeoxyribonuclease VII large subunit
MDINTTASIKPPLTVSQLTQEIRLKLESEYDWVQVRGEISNYKKAPSGHAYFSLKDKDAVLSSVAWKSSVIRWSSLGLEDGLEIIAGGKITVYPPRGQYQFVVSSIRLAGVGALQYRFETLKRMLAEEGLFDSNKKKPLPSMPMKIAVITSPTGAAIQDFLKVFHRGMYPVEIIVCPVLVQGEKAAPEIASMIEKVNQCKDVDILVLCRGGGSLEDLWAFNEECVARAIAKSDIPVVTGIGHEIDFTIADFAADYRASTPTGAAQTICEFFDQIRGDFHFVADRFVRCMEPWLHQERNRVDGLRRTLLRYHPLSVLNQHRQRLDEWQQSLYLAMKNALHLAKSRCLEQKKTLFRVVQNERTRYRGQISEFEQLLRSYDPARTLKRGFSICYKKDGSVLSTVREISPEDDIIIKVSDGTVRSKVTQVNPHE